MSIRSGASVCQDFAVSSVPVAAWIGSRSLVELVKSSKVSDHGLGGVEDGAGVDERDRGLDLG